MMHIYFTDLKEPRRIRAKQCIDFIADVFMKNENISELDAKEKAEKLLSHVGEIFPNECDEDKLKISKSLQDLGAIIKIDEK